MRWAVFDVDGTLLPSTSMEKMFIRHALKSGLFPTLNIVRYGLRAGRLLLAGKVFEAFKRNKRFLKGLEAGKIEAEAAAFFNREIADKFSSEGIARVEKHRQEGCKILIMTGSTYFLANRLDRIYHPDHLIPLNLEIHQQRYTGEIDGLHPYGEFKKQLLLAQQDALDIDFENSYVYANDDSDAAHMALFGHPVGINPSPKLEEICEERSWEVERWP